MLRTFGHILAAALFTVVLAGCGNETTQTTPPTRGETDESKIAAARAKLGDADRELVEAQEWCPAMPEERLGSMGVPIKLELDGQPVFVCCKSCKKKAEARPDEMLARVEELKAKKAGKTD